jgi:SAM-dependent methyltransferase
VSANFRRSQFLGFPVLVRIARRCYSHLLRGIDAWEDIRLGIQTTGVVEPDDIDGFGPNLVHASNYRGTPHLQAWLTLRRLRINHQDFVFLDVGSGMGRVIIRAAQYPFKSVEGVDFAHSMHGIASANVDRAWRTGTLLTKPTLYEEDATKFKLPDAPLLVFTFNPFGRPVFMAFLKHLDQSLKKTPRPCLVIYVNPVERDCFAEFPAFRELEETPWSKAAMRLTSPWDVRYYEYKIQRDR